MIIRILLFRLVIKKNESSFLNSGKSNLIYYFSLRKQFYEMQNIKTINEKIIEKIIKAQ